MFLWISLALAILSGLVSPFGTRLHATGLWAGKAMVPPKLSDTYPTGMQHALTEIARLRLGAESS